MRAIRCFNHGLIEGWMYFKGYGDHEFRMMAEERDLAWFGILSGVYMVLPINVCVSYKKL